MHHLRTRLWLVCITANALALAGEPPASQPIVPTADLNLDFERGTPDQAPEAWGGGGKGYKITTSTKNPHGGKQCASILAASREGDAPSFGTVTQELPLDALRGRRVRFSAFLRPTDITSGWAGLWLRVDGSEKWILGFDNMQSRPIMGTSDWKQYEIVLDVPAEAVGVLGGALLSGSGRLDVDDVAIEIVSGSTPISVAKAPVAQPGLFELRGEYELAPSLVGKLKPGKGSATLLLPMPICYREQVPLTYELTADPPTDVRAIRVFEDKPGNYVAEVKLNPKLPSGKLALRWRSIVLCGPRSFEDAPRSAPLPKEWPDEARPWLRSTRVAQSDDDRIKKIAAEIRGDSDDIMVVIPNTLKRARQIQREQKGQCTELDAVQALTRRGSCTSAANLMAALLRANHIPARILAGYPSWSGALQTHYIVEAFVPDYGWYPIESTRLFAPWQPCQQLEVAIVPPEYEDHSEARFPNGGGVPYLSLTECPGYSNEYSMDGTVDRARYCDHVAKLTRALPADRRDDWKKATHSARERWMAWLETASKTDKRQTVSTPITASDLDAVADFPTLLAKLKS